MGEEPVDGRWLMVDRKHALILSYCEQLDAAGDFDAFHGEVERFGHDGFGHDVVHRATRRVLPIEHPLRFSCRGYFDPNRIDSL